MKCVSRFLLREAFLLCQAVHNDKEFFMEHTVVSSICDMSVPYPSSLQFFGIFMWGQLTKYFHTNRKTSPAKRTNLQAKLIAVQLLLRRFIKAINNGHNMLKICQHMTEHTRRQQQ